MLLEISDEEIKAFHRIVAAFLRYRGILTHNDTEMDAVKWPPVPGIVKPIGGNRGDVTAAVAFDQPVDCESIPARAVVVAVDFEDWEFQSAFGSSQTVVSDVAIPFRPLHGRLRRASFVTGVDDIPSVHHAANRSNGSTSRFVGNRSARKPVHRVDQTTADGQGRFIERVGRFLVGEIVRISDRKERDGRIRGSSLKSAKSILENDVAASCSDKRLLKEVPTVERGIHKAYRIARNERSESSVKRAYCSCCRCGTKSMDFVMVRADRRLYSQVISILNDVETIVQLLASVALINRRLASMGLLRWPPSTPAVTFDVLFEFGDRFGSASATERVHDPLMASHSRFPFRFFDAIPELLEEDLKHFPERDHGGQPARFEECAMELDIQIDLGLEVFGCFQSIDQHLQRIDPVRMVCAVLDDVRDNPGFHDDARVDQFLRIDLVERRVES